MQTDAKFPAHNGLMGENCQFFTIEIDLSSVIYTFSLITLVDMHYLTKCCSLDWEYLNEVHIHWSGSYNGYPDQ